MLILMLILVMILMLILMQILILMLTLKLILILTQVQEMLRRMEYCETLFPSTKQLEKEHPTWATPQYKARVKVGGWELGI